MGKRTKLHLAPNLAFSTDIITEVIDIIAKRGAGKTYTAMKLAEEMLIVGAQVVAVDPVGNWYGLRLGADGKPKGGMDIVILGGRHGDIPLEYTAGKLVAKTIVEADMSVILDVSMMPKAKQRRFVTDFAEALLEYRKQSPSAMHVFWEEAYRFMPQKLQKGSQSEMLEATEELVTMGRNFGIGGTIICQRSAQISKTVLTQASILCIMNTTGLGDRQTIKAWIEYKKLEDQDLDLASLKKGEAFVWWPEEFGIKLVRVSKKTTYDASATPKFGEKRKHRKLRGVDLDALQGAMAETIEKIRGEDPRILRRRIAELEKQVAYEKARETDVFETTVEKEVLVINDGDLSAVGRVVIDTLTGMEKLGCAIDELKDQVARVQQIKGQQAKANGKPHDARVFTPTSRQPTLPLRPNMGTPARVAPTNEKGAPETERRFLVMHPRQVGKSTDIVHTDMDAKITAGALRMLKALAAISPGGLTRKQVAMQAQMKSKSGTFGNYWSKLNVAGFLRQHGSKWFITVGGMAYLGDDIPVQPDTPEKKLEFWCERLNGKSQEMLRYMFKHPDMTFSKVDIAEEVGLVPSSGTFGNYLSKLTSNNLAVRTAGGYRVSDELMA